MQKTGVKEKQGQVSTQLVRKEVVHAERSGRVAVEDKDMKDVRKNAIRGSSAGSCGTGPNRGQNFFQGEIVSQKYYHAQRPN